MVYARIDSKNSLHIPPEFRSLLPAGQQVTLSVDEQGRLLITPVEQIREALLETFGMWADRRDIPADGVEYMDEIRGGQRLESTLSDIDETH